jgi:hypothetical protein
MAQVKLLKIGTDGLAEEFNSAADDITLASFAITGGGPVLDATGLDLNNQDISDIDLLSFNDPTAGSIVLTAGTFVPDDLMFENKENSIDVGAAILFPVISDAAGEVDALRVPALAAVPTATPADGGTGYLVFDSANNDLYVWNGTSWDNLNTVEAANRIENMYTAGEDIDAAEVVYISAADTVSLADAATNYEAIGVAGTTSLDTTPVSVISEGLAAGFSGLTAGSRYFLSATAGAVTTTAPTASGARVLQVGYAKNATTMQLKFDFVGRRA